MNYLDFRGNKIEKDNWLVLPDYRIGKVKKADKKLEVAVIGENNKVSLEPSECSRTTIVTTLPLVSNGQAIEVVFDIVQYATNGATAVDLIWVSETGIEPWNNLTINLDGYPPKHHAYIDTNNNGNEIVEWLISNHLAEPTGLFRQSGFCVYPMMKLDMKGIQKYTLCPYDENDD